MGWDQFIISPWKKKGHPARVTVGETGRAWFLSEKIGVSSLPQSGSKKGRPERAGPRLSKKSSESWAFSLICDKISMGDEKCWNVESWIAA